jgi:branched-chain amino acid transport system substrate-binding protein
MLRGMMKSAAVAAAMLGFANAAVAAEPIKIGAFLSVTGGMSFLGDPEKKTLELYAERINKAGGVLGRKIELTVYDDASVADKSASFAKRLIENDEVDIIIGGSGTPNSMAVIPLIERAQMPYISLGGGISIVEPVKKWVFKVPHTDRMAAEKVLQDMKGRNITKIALLSEDVGFGKSGRDQTLAVAKQMGVEIVADEVYSPKDADVTPQLTRIKGAPGAQALFIFGTGQGPAVATKNFKQLGMTMPLYQSHGVVSKDFLKLVAGAAEGVRLPAAGLVVAEQLNDADPQKIVVTDFKKNYETAYKADVSTFAGHALDAFNIAIAAIHRAGGTDKAKVRDEIEKTSGYVGTGGTVSMSATDHLGLTLAAFHMVEIQNGDWKLAD